MGDVIYNITIISLVVSIPLLLIGTFAFIYIARKKDENEE